MSDQKYCKSAQQVSKQQQHQQQLQLQQQQLHQHLVRVDTPVTPPPPIPRRQLMRAKCAWQPGSMASDMACNDAQPNSASSSSSVFVYPQPAEGVGVTGGGGAGQSAMLVDIAARPAYADADGISDDDRMSLENSVFDESLTSTPVKVAANGCGVGSMGGAAAAAGAIGGYASRYAITSGHVAKRAQRSSSSTVDSAYGGSSSGGHSERFASSSTSVDFRSRFSSVDTQSSLDEKALSGSIDSPLAKDTCRLERAALNDVMHKLNNNLYASSSNNHMMNPHQNNNNTGGNKLPTVPARKLPQLPPVKLPPPPPPPHKAGGIHNSSSDCSKESSSSVSASASTSSAGSGSSTISSATMSSTSVSGAVQKRPSAPPEPPQRNLNSFECMETLPKVHAPPPLTVRNKLSRNKPPPIVYPKMQQRQDSTLSSDSYSISSSPGYNSKMMETPLLSAAQTTRKSAAPGMLQRQPLMDLPGTRIAPGRSSKLNFRQDSTISSDSFSQTSSPGYNPKLMEAPLLPSLSAKRLCSGKCRD